VGTTAKERILSGTRYVVEEPEVAKCISVLGSQGDATTEAAKLEIEERKRAKKAASIAESLRRKSELASEPSSMKTSCDDATSGKKKKKKKRKVEATVVEALKSFVPHEQRMQMLLGT
jgi:hypothetical protein